MKFLKKQITFDGFKFWCDDVCLGEIRKEHQLKSPIPKNIMDIEKDRIINQNLIGVI